MRIRSVFFLGAVGIISLIGNGHAQDLPFPENPDILMNNFRVSYSDMNLDEYEQVLHSDFRFIFQPSDIDVLGLPSDHIDREVELIIAANTFLGLVEPVVAQINFDIFDPETTWEPSTHPDFPPPAVSCFYNISLTAVRPTHTTVIVEGLSEFFAIARDSVIEGGSVLEYWELLGHRDLTGMTAHATETTTWGQFKWLYHDDTVAVSDDFDVPAPVKLESLHPNPFNPRITASFTVEKPQNVRVSVHDLAGHRVALLTDQFYGTGTHLTSWQGLNTRGKPVASGAYVVRLEAASHVETQKIMLAR